MHLLVDDRRDLHVRIGHTPAQSKHCSCRILVGGVFNVAPDSGKAIRAGAAPLKNYVKSAFSSTNMGASSYKIHSQLNVMSPPTKQRLLAQVTRAIKGVRNRGQPGSQFAHLQRRIG